MTFRVTIKDRAAARDSSKPRGKAAGQEENPVAGRGGGSVGLDQEAGPNLSATQTDFTTNGGTIHAAVCLNAVKDGTREPPRCRNAQSATRFERIPVRKTH